ncbi:MAG: type II secretion system F family protein [Thermoplasmata archaeon]|nr:MAG: type II secretion system F family protein [Thermoplasmata archaeon]
MAISSYQKLAYRIFRKRAQKAAEARPELDIVLEKAHMAIRSDMFLASVWMSALVGVIAGIILAAIMMLFIIPALASSLEMSASFKTLLNLLAVLFPVIFGVLGFFVTSSKPESRLRERATNIDKNLPYAVNYMAAMASADVSPALIFKGLARQKIYGDIQIEASLVTRDIEVFGKDLLKVLKRTIHRSPSVKFQDFVQGIITTSTSGGSLQTYFLSKSDQYMKENRLEQKATLETLGVMAESFVTVVVAAPLFLIVMMSVMAMMGGAGGTTFLYIIIGLMIPLSQFMFVVILSGISVD